VYDPHITVRKASPLDLEDLYSIEVECFHEDAFPKSYIKQLVEEPWFITLVALVDDKVAGFITGAIEIFKGKLSGHIFSIDVKPEYRGMGVGSRLLETIEDELRKSGVEVCYLEVYVNNTAAINLYLKHNYRFLERLRNYYGIERDGIRMMKKLVTE